MHDDGIRNLEPKKAGYLMGIALDSGQGGPEDSDAEIGEYLQACLRDTWSSEREPATILPRPIARLLGAHRAAEPRPLLSLLLDPRSRLGTMKEIRKRAKGRVMRQCEDAEHAAMTTIYFAAIANALVFHKTRITTHSYESLVLSFRMLSSKSWMPPALAELLGNAERACAAQAGEDQPHV